MIECTLWCPNQDHLPSLKATYRVKNLPRIGSLPATILDIFPATIVTRSHLVISAEANVIARLASPSVRHPAGPAEC